MQSKLLSGSQKGHNHEMRKGGCWFWFKRGSHRSRSKRKECFVFTLLTIMFFTALIWSYEPHLASLSSPQEQFGLRTSAASHRVTVEQEDVLLREPHLIRAQMEERSKPFTTNVKQTNKGFEKTLEDFSTKQWSSTDKESSSIEGSFSSNKDDKQGEDSSSSYRKKETIYWSKPVMENVQNTKLEVEESFTSKGSSTTQGSSQSSTIEGLSATKDSYDTKGFLAREREEKDSSSFTYEKQVDKPKPVFENVQNTNLVVEESFESKGSSTTEGSSQSSTTAEGLSATKGSNDTKDSLAREKDDKGSSFSTSDKKEIVDNSKPVTENVQNTELVVEESFTPKGSSTTRGSSQSSSTTEGISTNKGSNSTDGPLGRETEDQDSSSPTSKKKVYRPEPVTESIQNTTDVVEESSTSKESSITRGSSQSFATTDGLSAAKGSDGIEASLAREKADDKDSSSSTSEKKGDISKSEDRLVRKEPLLAEEKETKDKSKSRLKDVEPMKPFVKESSASNDSSTNKDVLRTEKEDKVATSTYQKKGDITKSEDRPVQKEPLLVEDKETKDKPKLLLKDVEPTKPFVKESSTSNDSSTSKDVLRTEKEDKVATSSYQKKAQVSKDITRTDDGPVREQLVTHKEAEDKPKTRLDTIEYKKPVANESSETSFASTNPSPAEESLRREQKNKVSASANENKEISKDMASPKDGPPLKEPLPIRKEMEDKRKAQMENVQSEKPLANESLAVKESSRSVTQDKSLTEESTTANGSSNTTGIIIRRKRQDKVVASTLENKECNYAKGRWVYDSGRPLYSGFKCKKWLPWIFACRQSIRTDFRFEHYRWQPENCDMPKFERHSFLKRMKNKTIAFVGDSLGRQQFQSFMCMLTGGDDNSEVEDVGPEYDIKPKNMAYRFSQTNTTIIYYWSSCLCDLTPINTSNPNAGVAMHLDRPPAFLRENLHKFDVLVLNTGHHWNRGKFKVNKWVMHVDGKPNMDKTLFTVGSAKNFTIFSIAKWVDSQLKSHPRGLKAFFRTISPRHFFGGEWNTGGSCENTTPLVHGTQVTKDESSDELVASAVKGTGVKLLDITALSALRDEGHISKYGHKANDGVRDCLHWCLPGIPDTWNEILAAQI